MSLNKKNYYSEVVRYVERSRNFLYESIKFKEGGEVEKLSEVLRGSLASALNAFALIKGVRLKSHKEVKDFARQLSLELQDEELHEVFRRAEVLHANFYHGFREMDDVVSGLEMIKAATIKIIRL